MIINNVLQERNLLRVNLCGQYCLYYAFAKCNGLSMEDIIDNMPDYQYVVEFVNRHYYICPKL